MRRDRKRSIALAFAAASLLVAGSASAFHAGRTFDDAPGAGGGGGTFYTGAPSERGWSCAACHVAAEGRIRVRLDATSGLFDRFAYVPGQKYAVTATLEGEHLGLGSPRANFNSLALSVMDESGQPAGTIGGFSADDFYSGGPATIASAGQKAGQTKWTFEWTAPDAGGRLSFYLAAVDGNGADSGSNGTLTDPFGDDIFVGALSLDGPAKRASRAHTPLGFALAAFAGFFVRRAGTRKGEKE